MFIIAPPNFFMMVALKYFLDNWHPCDLPVTVFWMNFYIWFEIFLVLVMMSDNWWKPEHVGYCVVRLWIWLKPPVLCGFLWHCPEWERVGTLPCYHPGGDKSTFPTQPLWAHEERDLLTSEELWEGDSPLGLQGHLPCFPVAPRIPRAWPGNYGSIWPRRGRALVTHLQEGPGY